MGAMGRRRSSICRQGNEVMHLGIKAPSCQPFASTGPHVNSFCSSSTTCPHVIVFPLTLAH
jgi:hypothetical protein